MRDGSIDPYRRDVVGLSPIRGVPGQRVKYKAHLGCGHHVVLSRWATGARCPDVLHCDDCAGAASLAENKAGQRLQVTGPVFLSEAAVLKKQDAMTQARNLYRDSVELKFSWSGITKDGNGYLGSTG